MALYFVGLKKAVDKIEGINHSPKPKETDTKPVKSLDDLPF